MHTLLLILILLAVFACVGALYCVIVYGKEMMGMIEIMSKKDNQLPSDRPDYFR